VSKPLISVILPVYNGQKYLNQAIDSILCQTYADFELIVIDDGSTDATGSIMGAYRDPRIRYVRQENTGIGGALRHGCNLAGGTYFARMDADDICFPNRLEIQKKYLDDNPDTVLVSSAVVYIDDSGNAIGRSFPYTSDSVIRKKLQTMNPVCHPGVMMRTEAYKKSVGYLDIQPFEDHILWLSMSRTGKLHNFRFPLLYYRVLEDSASRTIPAEQSKMLFGFLHEKLKNGNLQSREIKEYYELYREAKRTIVHLSHTGAAEGSKKNPDPVTSAKQAGLYHFLTSLRIPEGTIEQVICTFKNTFLRFK
jgi:glycosyltransferase involved in cell wall biosynthesis